ncbi:MAG: hypothetical protein ACPGXL_08470, partial [Chitinophagales bacterium]
GHYITTDFMKNAYVLTNKNQVMKYDSLGTVMGSYSENRYGNATSVDATSPFNTLVFYQDQSTIVSLDLRLNPRQLYRLSTVDINNIGAMCLSQDNNIWVYDMDSSRLRKINQDYEVMYESLNLSALLGTTVEPNFMIERDGLIYLNVPNLGIMMFDIYGNYYNSVSYVDLGIEGIDRFQVVSQKIVFFYKDKLVIYDIWDRTGEALPVPQTIDTKEMRVERGLLYMLKKKELEFYAAKK